MYFINTDPLLEYDYSLPQNVVPVGGLHIDHVKPLFSVSFLNNPKGLEKSKILLSFFFTRYFSPGMKR